MVAEQKRKKSKGKNTELALTNAVQAAVTPPPRKSEMIEAMAILKHRQLTEQKAKYDAECNRLEQEYRKLALRDFESGPWTWDSYISEDHPYRNGDRIYEEIVAMTCRAKIAPKADTKKAYAKWDEYRRKADIRIDRVPTLCDIRRKIRDAMAGNTTPNLRVTSLVDDPVASKALTAMLAALDRKAAAPAALPAPAAEVEVVST